MAWIFLWYSSLLIRLKNHLMRTLKPFHHNWEVFPSLAACMTSFWLLYLRLLQFYCWWKRSLCHRWGLALMDPTDGRKGHLAAASKLSCASVTREQRCEWVACREQRCLLSQNANVNAASCYTPCANHSHMPHIPPCHTRPPSTVRVWGGPGPLVLPSKSAAATLFGFGLVGFLSAAKAWSCWCWFTFFRSQHLMCLCLYEKVLGLGCVGFGENETFLLLAYGFWPMFLSFLRVKFLQAFFDQMLFVFVSSLICKIN